MCQRGGGGWVGRYMCQGVRWNNRGQLRSGGLFVDHSDGWCHVRSVRWIV